MNTEEELKQFRAVQRLWTSVARGDEATMRELLGLHPALGGATDWAGKESLLMVAACRGRLNCVEWLLPISDLEARNNQRFTALMLAAYKGHASCVRAIVRESAKRLSALELTLLADEALLWTSVVGRADCARELGPYCTTQRVGLGGTPLLQAANARGDAVECVRVLLPMFDPQAVDEEGQDALSRAFDRGNWKCVDTLLAALPDTEDVAARAQHIWGLASVAERQHLPHCLARIEREILTHSLPDQDTSKARKGAVAQEWAASEEHGAPKPINAGGERRPTELIACSLRVNSGAPCAPRSQGSQASADAQRRTGSAPNGAVVEKSGLRRLNQIRREPRLSGGRCEAKGVASGRPDPVEVLKDSGATDVAAS